MRRRPAARSEDVREIAADVFCLGPWGRTQTDVYIARSGGSWVLIDAGWAGDGPRIAAAAASLFGSASRPEAILLTHCHPDHSGAARELAERWDCDIFMHPAELPIAHGDFAAMRTCAGPLDRYVVLPLMLAVGRRRREAALARSSLRERARSLAPGCGVPGLPGWECLPTPGHTPGHVSYVRPADGVLISGDALVTLQVNSLAGVLGQAGLSGPPWYTTWDRSIARESILEMARLKPSVVCGGHGRPLQGPGTAAALLAFAGRVAGGTPTQASP
jgi:glyoxylase-like metal-dependent hydrolase (beta-lactamase superfamily II)